jgi:hypothetical protein
MGCAELRKLLLLLLLLHVAWHRVVLPVEDKPSQSLKEAILAGGKKVGAAPAVGISLSNHLSALIGSSSSSSRKWSTQVLRSVLQECEW